MGPGYPRPLMPRLQGLFGGAAQPEQGVLAPRRPGFLGRFSGALGEVFAGQNDQNLSPEQNAAARKQALLQAGLATIMSSGPGAGGTPSALQAIAAGAMAGQQGGMQARQQMGQQQAMQNPLLGLSPQQRAMLAALPPEQQAEVLAKLATQGPAEAKVVGPGAALVGADGRPLYSHPGAENSPALPAEARVALWSMGVQDPAQATPEQRQRAMEIAEQYRRSGATQVNVDARDPVQKGMDATGMKQYDAAVELANTAQQRLQSLGVMESLLNAGMATGRLDDLTEPLRGIAASFGVGNADKLGQQQAFNALANQLTLLSKAGMTGPMSDRDIKFLQGQVPQLYNTPEGNRLIIHISRRVAEHQQARAEEMDRYLTEKGTAVGMLRHMSQWTRQNPISLDDLRQQLPPFMRGN